MPRFDPTAFVKAKEKKQREIKMKLAPIFSSPAHIPAPLPGPLICVFIYPCLPFVSITCHLLHLSPPPSGGLPALVVTHRAQRLPSRNNWAHRQVSPFPFPRQQQQQRNRLGSGGSGDGPSISWARQTRRPAAVTGRGDAANRSRNRSSSGNALERAGQPAGWAGPASAGVSPSPPPSSGQFPQPLLISQLLQRVRGFL